MAASSSGSTPNSAASASTVGRFGHGKMARSTRGSFGDLSAACQPSRTAARSEEHTSELQSPCNLVCRLLLEKKKQTTKTSCVPGLTATYCEETPAWTL